MRRMHSLPLRIGIPILLFFVALVVAPYTWYANVRRAEDLIEATEALELRELATHVRRTAQHLARRGETDDLRDELTVAGGHSDVVLIALLDEANRVLAASRPDAEQGSPEAVLPAFSTLSWSQLTSHLSRARRGHDVLLELSAQGRYIFAFAPVTLAIETHRAGSPPIGILFLQTDLAAAKATARSSARRDALTELLMVFVGVVLLGFSLDRLVTRRLRSLARTAARFGAGDRAARAPVDGPKELADLGRTFNAMAQQLGEDQDALLSAKRFNEGILSSINEGICVYDREFVCIARNRFMAELSGIANEDVVGKALLDQFPTLRPHDIEAVFRTALAGRTTDLGHPIGRVKGSTTVLPPGAENELTNDSGVVWTWPTYHPYRDESGQVIGVIQVVSDYTQRKRAEDEIKSSNRSLLIQSRQTGALAQLGHHALTSGSFDMLTEEATRVAADVLGTEIGILYLLTEQSNEFYCKAAHGVPRELYERHRVPNDPKVPPGPTFARGGPVATEDLRLSPYEFPPVLFELGIVSAVGVPLYTRGQPAGVLAVRSKTRRIFSDSDVNFLQSVGHVLAAALEREHNEQELRDREAELRLVTDNMAAALFYFDRDQIIRFHNRVFALTLGRSREQINDHSLNEVLGETAYGNIKNFLSRALSGETVQFERDHTLAGREVRRLSVRFAPRFDSTNAVKGGIAIETDVTEQYRAESQLRQAQKMEAVGQLTGGIAHDFNNLLTVIAGNLQLLEDGVGSNPCMVKSLQTALHAVESGAELTHKLLTFSRQQTLQSRPTDINRLVADTAEMLVRTLGKLIDVRTILEPMLPNALVDPTQLETAILNLALNARDAMPHGGTLKIETGLVVIDGDITDEVEGGPYVTLTVSDNGDGMRPETAARAFEPFFSTKSFGKGSGLGLSMVYGFVKQSGGHITLHSEQGCGTIFCLYFPAAQMGLESTRSNKVRADA